MHGKGTRTDSEPRPPGFRRNPLHRCREQLSGIIARTSHADDGDVSGSQRGDGQLQLAEYPYGVELSKEAVCWSDVLKEEGYRTAYIGKWHLDAPYRPYVDTYNNKGEVAWDEWCPPERRHGFDKWIAYGTYDNHLKPMYWDTKSGREEFYYVNQWGPAYEADRAIEFIRTEGTKTDRPFAMVVSMNPPHTGYELVPETYKRLYDSLDVEALADSCPTFRKREPLKATTSAKTSATTTPASPE